MRKLALLLFAFSLALAPPSWAQSSGTITNSAGQCPSIDASRIGTVSIQITGTWTGTLTPEISVGGQAPTATQVTPANSSTPQTSITANNVYYAAGGGVVSICGPTSSGTANVYLQPVPGIARNGGSFPGKTYYASQSLICNGSTDNTAAFQALLNTVSAAGGGVIDMPLTTYANRCVFNSARITGPINGDSYVDGAGTISTAQHIRITCDGPAPDLQILSSGAAYSALNPACYMDLQYNDPTAKLFFGGMGEVEIDHIALVDSNTADCTTNQPAFILVTNARLYIHDTAILGALETLPQPGAPTLTLIAGASSGTAVWVRLSYVNGTLEQSFVNPGVAGSTQTPSTSQQIQVTSPPAWGQATAYNVYASSSSGGTYWLQNTGGAIAIGTNYTVPGTILTSGTQAPANNSAYSCNVAILAGGTGTTQSSTSVTAPFQGYGLVAENNFANSVKQLVLAQTYANDLKVIYNKIWSQSGCSNCGAIEFNAATSLAAGSSTIIGNLIECVHFPYGVQIAVSADPNNIVGNNCYDTAEFSTIDIYSPSATPIVGPVFGGFSNAYNIASSDVWTNFWGMDTTWSRSGKMILRTDDFSLNDQSGHLRSSNTGSQTATDTAPTCTMNGTSGSCSYSFTTTWAFAPRCAWSWNGTGTLSTIPKITTSTSAVTATSTTTTDTAVINFICVGAPR